MAAHWLGFVPMISPQSPSPRFGTATPVSTRPGIDDVIYGCANQAGEDNRNVARMALLLAGIPKEVPGQP